MIWFKFSIVLVFCTYLVQLGNEAFFDLSVSHSLMVQYDKV